MADTPKYEDSIPAYEDSVAVPEEEAKALLVQPPKVAATKAGQPSQVDPTEAFIAKEESFRARPYDDGAGNITIGYGHVIKPNERHLLNKTLSEQEARQLLRQDIESHRTPWLRGVNVPLTKGQEMALTSLAFNVGPYNKGFRKLITHLNKGETKQAASMFDRLTGVYHKETGEKLDMGGVTKRRQTERALFSGSLTPEAAIGAQSYQATATPSYEDSTPVYADSEATTQAMPAASPPPKYEDSEAADASSVLGAFGQGVKEALLPFAVDKADSAGIDTLPEVGASIAGNLAATIAAGVAAGKVGAAVGTAVAPGAGTLAGAIGGGLGGALYAVYSGFGEEKLRSMRAGQEFSPVRAVTQAGLQLNPVLRATGKVEKLVRIGAQAVGSYATERSYGSDEKTAAVAGALGAFGAAFISKRQALAAATGGRDVAKEVVDALTTGQSGINIIQRTVQKEAEIPRVPLEEAMQNDDFKRFVLSRPGSGALKAPNKKKALDRAFQREVGTLGMEALSVKPKIAELNDMWHTYKASMVAVAEANKELTNTLSGKSGMSAATKAFQHDMDVNAAQDALYDTLFMAKTVDDRVGSNLEGLFSEYGAMKERFNTMTHAILSPAGEAAKAASAAGLTNKDIGMVLAGKAHLLTPEAAAKINSEAGQEVVERWRDVWDAAREAVSSTGVRVNYLENYLPMKQLRGADLASAVDRYAADIAEGMNKFGATKFSAFVEQLDEEVDGDIISKIQDLVSLGNRVGKPVDSLTDLKFLKEEALKGNGKLAKNIQIGAAFERGDEEIADALRDYDVGNALVGYLNGNLKGGVMRDTLHKLSVQADVLHGLGMTTAGNWVRQRIGILSGGMGKGDAIINGLQQRYQYTANKMMASTSTSARRVGKSMDAAGDFMGFLTSRYYPAFLGLNIRAAIRNTTQPFIQGIPELGYGYGSKVVAKAALSSANKLRKGVGQAEAELHNLGITSKYYTADNLLDENSLRRIGGVIKKGDEAVMAPFGLADKFNRLTAVETAKIWANDLAKGDKGALEALSKAGTGLKQQLLSEGLVKNANNKPSDMARLQYVLAHYINQKTQFLYGKEFHSNALVEAGRAFSMFTKWPSIMASDLAYTAAKKDLAGLMRRFAVPTGILVMANSLMEAEDNPTMKYAIGDLTQVSPLSPISSVDKVMGGGPIVQAATGTLKATTEAVTDPSTLKDIPKKLAKEVVITYTPVVSSIIREADRWQKAFGNEALSDKLFPDE